MFSIQLIQHRWDNSRISVIRHFILPSSFSYTRSVSFNQWDIDIPICKNIYIYIGSRYPIHTLFYIRNTKHFYRYIYELQLKFRCSHTFLVKIVYTNTLFLSSNLSSLLNISQTNEILLVTSHYCVLSRFR